jgi:tetratricopeptide (TPR) repeat protein
MDESRENAGEPCKPFAADLSALVDGEVDETVARRLVVHLEICSRCRTFFTSMRQMASTHRQVAAITDSSLGKGALRKGQPSTVVPQFDRAARMRIQRIVGRRVFRRFAAVLYRIAKAYLLITADRTYRTEVFRQPVALDVEAVKGRKLLNRILAKGEGQYAGYDWVQAGRLLHRTLNSDDDLRERARALLEEALRLKPKFAEARLYLGFYHKLRGDLDSAEREFREVFEQARSVENRGHAGTQLVTVHEARGDYGAALKVIERMLARRLPENDSRFYFTYFNLAVIHSLRGDFSPSADALATLARRFPERMGEIRAKLAQSEPLRQAFRTSPEFRANVERRVPALFADTN